MFITSRALITVRKDPAFDIEPVVERWDSSEDLAANGVSFLLYGLLDYLVDGHFPGRGVPRRGRRGRPRTGCSTPAEARSRSVQRKSFQLRKSLVLLRRITLPMREVVNSLLRQDLGIVPEPMAPYYRDVYDHVIRATEWTESLRDLVTTIVETNLTEQGNRMNLIMKKVTSWAAIIAVPTAITGWYGQNLPYPGFRQTVRAHHLDRRRSPCSQSDSTSCSAAKTGSDRHALRTYRRPFPPSWRHSSGKNGGPSRSPSASRLPWTKLIRPGAAA